MEIQLKLGQLRGNLFFDNISYDRYYNLYYNVILNEDYFKLGNESNQYFEIGIEYRICCLNKKNYVRISRLSFGRSGNRFCWLTTALIVFLKREQGGQLNDIPELNFFSPTFLLKIDFRSITGERCIIDARELEQSNCIVMKNVYIN